MAVALHWQAVSDVRRSNRVVPAVHGFPREKQDQYRVGIDRTEKDLQEGGSA